MVIYKEQVPAEPGLHDIEVREGYKILSVQMQNNLITIWFEVDEYAPEMISNIQVITTGQVYRLSSKLNYVSTVQDGRYVWHVFQILK